MLYAFMALVTALLFVRLTHVNYQQKQQDNAQPKDYVMASGDLVSSPLAAALDPRVDLATAQQQLMADPVDMPIEPGQGLQQELQFDVEPELVAAGLAADLTTDKAHEDAEPPEPAAVNKDPTSSDRPG